MTFMIVHAGLSDSGKARSENEDRWNADPAQGLYIVSDGIGGGAAGGLAAQIVVQSLPALLRSRLTGLPNVNQPEICEHVKTAILEVSTQLRQQTEDAPHLRGMGATVVLALIRENGAMIAHLGDSRAYRLHQDRLEQLTRDHSLIQLLLESGDITPEEVPTHPARGQLTQYVGMEGETLPEARFIELKAGNRLLLCSDGLTSMVHDEEIQRILQQERLPENACQCLIKAANDVGGKDNSTAIVIAVTDDSLGHSK